MALAAGRGWPTSPQYQKPTSLASLLGNELLSQLPTLNAQTQDEIWQLFDRTLLKKIDSTLPLCPTNYGGTVKNGKSLSTAFVNAMSAKTQSAVVKIRSNNFYSRQFPASRGIHCLAAPVPQFSFLIQYLPIDTRVLKQLLYLTWGDDQHPDQEMLMEIVEDWKADQWPDTTYKKLRDEEFEACRSEWWSRLFNIYDVKGVRVHGIWE